MTTVWPLSKLHWKGEADDPKSAAAPRARVDILRTTREIEGVRQFWSSCRGTLDSDLDIFLPLQARTPDPLHPCVFVLYRGIEPAALLAARIVRRRFMFKVGWHVLFQPLVNALIIPAGGLRGEASTKNSREILRAVHRVLKNGEADLAHFRSVEAGSELHRCLRGGSSFLLREHLAPVRPHRKRDLPANAGQLNSGLSHHERKRFRQIERALLTEFSGQVQVVRMGAARDLDHALAVAEEIAAKSWQRLFGARLSPADHWQRQSLRTMADRGWLRIYFLYLADRPAAYSLGAVYGGAFHSLLIGYDSQYARFSPGTGLLARVMEELCLEGVGAIDFGPSDEAYKARFGNITVQESDLHLFAPTLVGLSLSAMSAATNLLRSAGKAAAEHTGTVQWLKRASRKMRSSRAKGEKNEGDEDRAGGGKAQSGGEER